jgi:hypothetical protein
MESITLKTPVSASVYSQRMSHKSLSKLTDDFFKKMEDHAVGSLVLLAFMGTGFTVCLGSAGNGEAAFPVSVDSAPSGRGFSSGFRYRERYVATVSGPPSHSHPMHDSRGKRSPLHR